MIFKILGVLAVVLQLAGMVPYILDILKGKTKPERASYWIFSVLVAITFATQVSERMSWAAILVGISLICLLVIAILSIRYGYGKFRKKDALSMVAAVIGVVLWQLSSEPVVATLTVIAIDIAGFWLILIKTWRAPQTETLVSWAAGALSCTLAIIASQSFNFVQIGYLAYAAVANWVITLMILYRRRQTLYTKSV